MYVSWRLGLAVGACAELLLLLLLWILDRPRLLRGFYVGIGRILEDVVSPRLLFLVTYLD